MRRANAGVGAIVTPREVTNYPRRQQDDEG
jgi:hypothetical protein